MKAIYKVIVLLVILTLTAACSLGGSKPTQSPATETAAPTEAVQATATQFIKPTKAVLSTKPATDGSLRQWASSATASSEYDNPNWSADQATGAPDVDSCSDNQMAWASESPTGVDWIELSYDKLVTVSEINIHHTFSPNQVTEVLLIDDYGANISVYRGKPENISECPFVQNIQVEKPILAQKVKISIDQSKGSTSWNEIDAVELVGKVEQASVKPTNTPGAKPTEAPTEAVAEAPAFFRDDLDGTLSSDWFGEVTKYHNDNSIEVLDVDPLTYVTQEDGMLEFRIEEQNILYYWNYGAYTYEDVRIAFEAINRGRNDNNVGLACRYNNDGWYEFIAQSNGMYTIIRYHKDGDKTLRSGGIRSIRIGEGQRNVFEAVCEGNTLRFIVNGVEITNVTDDMLAEGYAGINISALDLLPVVVDVDWIEISEP